MELQSLCKAVTRIGNSISKKISSYNAEISLNEEKVDEQEVFSSFMNAPGQGGNTDTIHFWKCIEQIALTKIGLEDLILSLGVKSIPNFSEPEFHGLQGEHTEYFMKQHRKLMDLKASAQILLNRLGEMFSQDVLELVKKIEIQIFKIRREEILQRN